MLIGFPCARCQMPGLQSLTFAWQLLPQLLALHAPTLLAEACRCSFAPRILTVYVWLDLGNQQKLLKGCWTSEVLPQTQKWNHKSSNALHVNVVLFFFRRPPNPKCQVFTSHSSNGCGILPSHLARADMEKNGSWLDWRAWRGLALHIIINNCSTGSSSVEIM